MYKIIYMWTCTHHSLAQTHTQSNTLTYVHTLTHAHTTNTWTHTSHDQPFSSQVLEHSTIPKTISCTTNSAQLCLHIDRFSLWWVWEGGRVRGCVCCLVLVGTNESSTFLYSPPPSLLMPSSSFYSSPSYHPLILSPFFPHPSHSLYVIVRVIDRGVSPSSSPSLSLPPSLPSSLPSSFRMPLITVH